MDFSNYLEEAFSERMKKSIDKKLLTKVGKALAKHVGVGVEQSQFTYVPGYRFRLGAAHPSKTGDKSAVEGYVIVVLKDGTTQLISVADSRTAYIVWEDGRQIARREKISSMNDYVKGVKEAYIVERQDRVATKQQDRKFSKIRNDHLAAVHYEITKRMEVLRAVGTDYVKNVNAKLNKFGVKLTKLAAKNISDDRIGVCIQFECKDEMMERAFNGRPEVIKDEHGAPHILYAPRYRVSDIDYIPNNFTEVTSDYFEVKNKLEEYLETFRNACEVSKIIYDIDISKIMVKED
jgi:hypothetical protein